MQTIYTEDDSDFDFNELTPTQQAWYMMFLQQEVAEIAIIADGGELPEPIKH